MTLFGHLSVQTNIFSNSFTRVTIENLCGAIISVNDWYKPLL